MTNTPPPHHPSRPVQPQAYGEDWIRETWGWDSPEAFIASQGKNIRPRVQEIIRIAHFQPGMRLLDIGCGRGELVLHCAREGIHALGVDYSQDVIEIAQQAKARHSPDQQQRMTFLCKDVKDLDADQRFDRITMLDLVEHLLDWELHELFQLCHERLTNQGCILIHTLPNRWLYEITYKRLLRLFMPWLPKDPRSEEEIRIHINEMSITHLHTLLQQSNFQSRIWLRDMIVPQARWHAKNPLPDRRGKLYHFMSKPIVGWLYKALTLTPLRLLIVNDIFAVAWKPHQPCPISPPKACTERLFLNLYTKINESSPSSF